MTTLFVDADACPVTREAIAVARARHVPVVLVGNATQCFDRYTVRSGVEAVEVPSGRDAADFAIIERLAPGDVVVTQDIGVAAMVLGRGARAISVRGRVFSAATIDAEMAVRHAEQRHRRAGGRTRGPAAFEDEDRERFRGALERVLREALGE
ncbi:MAG: YaiI/YqxD family protein [Coriobacteriia bacterium]|nr:YaiI/YqxD family protein [Coriobacteriia bacterium]